MASWAQGLKEASVSCKEQGPVSKQDKRAAGVTLPLPGPSLRASQDGALLEGSCLKARYLGTVDQESRGSSNGRNGYS